jgi:ribosome-associated protein
MTKSSEQIQIPQDCIRFTFSRSPGPGGQNVNKVNTRATLICDVTKCTAFSDWQKSVILGKLAARTDKNNCIHITCSRFRSQTANRKAALDKLHSLISEALVKPKPRKKTVVKAAVKQKRLKLKKQRAGIKKQRSFCQQIPD